jgi:hypothetical protein
VVLLLIVTHVTCVLAGLFARAALHEIEQRRAQRLEPQLFTQQGQITLGGDNPFKVYYATPYVSEPNLTVESSFGAQGHSQFFVKEQEKNGFQVVPKTQPGVTVTIRWTAKGRLAR